MMETRVEREKDWVEIIEPRSKEHMYANLASGECVWDPPEGVSIKRADSSQWWELFDPKTDRFYYYNVASQKTVWHKPQNCDIIPLAKLQILKQSSDMGSESKSGEESNPQPQHQQLKQHIRSNSKGGMSQIRPSEFSSDSQPRHSKNFGVAVDKRTGELLCSPSGRHSLQHQRLPAVDDFNIEDSHSKFCKHGQGPSSRSQKYLDSGKSSDSSMSSGYRRLHEGGSLRIGSQTKKYGADNNYRMLQESSSSHNIPHVPLAIDKNLPTSHQKISYSISNSSDLAAGSINSPAHSAGTPLMKKKLLFESSSNHKKDREGSKSSKNQSFDYPGNPLQAISLTRSGSFMSAAANVSAASRQQQPSTQQQPQQKGSFDGNSDDSMHEKYFKSVESTPVSRRRHTTSSKTAGIKQSSDSSPQSPVSPLNPAPKSLRPSVLGIEPSSYSSGSKSSSQKCDPDMINLDIAVKQGYTDKMKLDKGKSPSGQAHSVTNLRTIQQINQLLKPLNNKSSSSQHEPNSNSLSKNSLRHNSKDPTLDRKTSQNSQSRKKNYSNTLNSEVEYDNGNTSPLYSNWDQEMQDHLLPLQHYILEQNKSAKLSGCYGNEHYDSDSIHSDSHSEHSFSGHEPDNEDSDQDGHGDYLSHHPYDEYGTRGAASYYNFEMNYDRNDGREDISEQVTAKLESLQPESLQDQIYSPVKHHAPPMLKFGGFSGMHPPPKPTGMMPGISHKEPMPFHLLPQQSPHQNQSTLGQYSASKGSSKTLMQRFQEQLSTNSSEKMAEMALIKECDIEKFAQDNLNLHSKGIFRKKSSVRDMLSWTSSAITRPMLSLARDKAGKKLAIDVFKLVQIYMGDRKARAGMSLNSVASDIISTSVMQPTVRDELYVQMCRQTTENPKRESLIRGWELLAILLSFVPPSPTFQPALLGYMNRHRDLSYAKSFPEIGKWPIHVQISHYATICCRRLQRIGSSGKKQAKKPTEEDINQSREQIFRDSMFGNNLTEVMELQKDIFPDRKLPWIQHTLSEQILLLGGKVTEGIFRVSADVDEVNCLKAYVDKWEFPENKGTMDAHAPASLLKLWYRELYDPLIPDHLYDECVQTEDPKEVAAIVEKLPAINKMVLMYLVRFLQEFSQADVVINTKMDSSNLAMVFAPNCLRCTSNDPKVILENARKEMAFMRTLIQIMDTSGASFVM